MLSVAFLAALGLAQAVSDAPEPAQGAYLVEDPFAIEEETATMESAPAAPASPPAGADAAPPSPDRLICRSRTEPGARTRRVRVCLTAAQWQLHRNNMEQQRRDINDWGKNGMPIPR